MYCVGVHDSGRAWTLESKVGEGGAVSSDHSYQLDECFMNCWLRYINGFEINLVTSIFKWTGQE